MGAIRSKAWADIRRRRLQTFAITSVLLLATASATLALDTLVESDAPFERAFAAANGAHLVIDFDPATEVGRVAATGAATGVTSSSGPWAVGFAGFPGKGGINGTSVGAGVPMLFQGGAISARPSAAGLVDVVTVSAGRWWQAPGEIVVGQRLAEVANLGLGDSITVQQAPPPGLKGTAPGPVTAGPTGGAPLQTRTLTIVGIAGSVSTPDVFAWMSSPDLSALNPGGPTGWQMLYRVSPSATTADLTAATRAITASLGETASYDVRTYLDQRATVDITARVFVPILLAFSIFALLAAAFIIANVVAGIVLGSYREIGVMKAIGFTPAQVTATLLVQILVPAAVGIALGLAIGTIGSQPTLQETARSFGLPAPFTLTLPVVALVALSALAIAFIAAIGPAIRAGRLSATTAITRGTAPARRATAGRLRTAALRLPVPVPMRLGIASAGSNPARTGMTIGALVVGVAAVVFSLGLSASLDRVATGLIRAQASPIRAHLEARSATPSEVTAAIAGSSQTRRSVALGGVAIHVAGLADVTFTGYDGDSSWLGYELIQGRWFAAPGEAVAPTSLFTQTGLHLGDRATLVGPARAVNVTLVGEIFDQGADGDHGPVIRGSWADLARFSPAATPTDWEAAPIVGVDPEAYRSTLGDATGHAVSIQVVADSDFDDAFVLFRGVIALLGAVLVAISIGGVFNTVLLDTRRRTRETAVLRAIGMTPAQVLSMVVASVVPLGLAAGVLGVPLGIVFQRVVLGFMGQAASGTNIPDVVFEVFGPLTLVALGLVGLAIATAGAYLPAQRAAATRIAPVLQAE